MARFRQPRPLRTIKFAVKLQRESVDVEEFGLLLSLVKELDEPLAKNIALQAKKHRNPGVQEIGTAYLDELGS
jgi:hypothetical protein